MFEAVAAVLLALQKWGVLWVLLVFHTFGEEEEKEIVMEVELEVEVEEEAEEEESQGWETGSVWIGLLLFGVR